MPESTSNTGEISCRALRPGQWARVVRVLGGRGLTQRTLAMGLTPNTVFRVLANLGGPMIIRVRGVKLAVGCGMAERILVTPCDPPAEGDN